MDKDLADQGAGQSWYLGGGRIQARGILATAEHRPGPRPADH